MTHVKTHIGRRYRFRALALLAVLIGACDATDRLANNEPPTGGVASDPVPTTDPPAISALWVTRSGTPFGPDGLWSSYTTLNAGNGPFNGSINSDSPSGISKRIAAARAVNHVLVLMMTGGSHSNYITNYKFDYYKWKARMDLYKTSAIRDAVARGLADGTVIGNNMLDEPNHPSWGGVITKAVLDRMATYVKSIFPGLPAGVSVRWDWRPTERYKVVDFITTQYVTRFGSVTTWRDQARAAASLNRIAVIFAFNPINGGTKISGCPLGPTGGYGTYGGNCKMTPTQIRYSGYALAPYGCALQMWRYDYTFMTKSANVSAFKDVASRAASSTHRSCRRY
jgi:hypothetical protein